MTAGRSPAQQRVIEAALALFAEHGVNGTSLQMIAGALGVTKAAVYHQFPTKDEIVLAVVEGPLAELEAHLGRAVGQRSGRAARRVLAEGLVDLVVRHRGVVGTMAGDPGMSAIVESAPRYSAMFTTFTDVLVGASPTRRDQVRAAMVLNAVMMAGASALVVDVPDDELRAHLLDGVARLLG